MTTPLFASKLKAELLGDIAENLEAVNTAGTTQITAVNDAGAAQVANATAQADRAAASAASAAIFAASATAALAGSALFLNGNGERQRSEQNGLLEIPSAGEMFKTTAAGDSPMFASGSGDAWACIVALPVEQLRFVNRTPVLWGSGATAAIDTAQWGINFTPQANNTAANRRTFYARVSQGSTTGATVRTAQCPDNMSGVGLLQLYEAGGTLFLEFTDFVTGDKTVGSTALSAGFTGKTTTGRLTIGGLRPDLFPTDILTAWSNATTAAMCSDVMMRDFAFLERKLTDAEIVLLRDGTPFTSIVAEADRRLYCPLASNGALSLSIQSNKAGVPAELSQLGNVGAGSSLTGQTAAKRLRLARQMNPCLVGAEFGADTARFNIRIASQAGLTGTIKEGRVTSRGSVVKDWHRLEGYNDGSSDWVVLNMPLNPAECEVQVRSAGDPEIIATISRVYTCIVPTLLGQSEVQRTLAVLANGSASFDNADATGGFDAVPDNCFVLRRVADLPGSIMATVANINPAFYGAGAIEFFRHMRTKTELPICLPVLAMGGTAMREWMDDADADRSRADDIALAGMLANRTAEGRIPVTCFVQGAWWISDESGNAGNFSTRVYPAWLRGETTAYISTISGYLYDGAFSLKAPWAVTPAGRRGTLGSLQNSDTNNAALTREDMRVAANLFGGKVGPEPTLIFWQDNALSGVHPLQNSIHGDRFFARCLAETALVGLEVGDYRGPSRFASYQLVDGNTAAIVTLDTPWPGTIRTNVAAAAPAGFEVQLTTAGGRSRLNASSIQILNGRQVRVNLVSAATPAEFALWYHSGGPGDYRDAAINTAWLQGSLMFNDWPIVGSNTVIPVAT